MEMQHEFDRKNFEKALNLGKETLQTFHKLYGDYHPYISFHMANVCPILFLANRGDMKRNFDFFNKINEILKNDK